MKALIYVNGVVKCGILYDVYEKNQNGDLTVQLRSMWTFEHMMILYMYN